MKSTHTDSGRTSQVKSHHVPAKYAKMRLDQLDENDISGTVSEWEKKQKAAREKEERLEQEKDKHSGKRTSHSTSNPTSDKRAERVSQKGKHGDSTRRESAHSLKPEEKRTTKPQNEAKSKKTSTPRSNSTAHASTGAEKKTPSAQREKSNSSDWGSWKTAPEDIEEKTRNEFRLIQEYEGLGIANFSLEKHNDLNIRMLAFGPGKKTFSGNRGQLILYTSKKGNGLFLIDKTDSSPKPVMPSIEPKIDCKTSVVFNKDEYYVEEARLDSEKLNKGDFPLKCIKEKLKVKL